MLFGHVAISALLHRYIDVDLGASVAGGLAPDVVDKTLCQVLHATPNGRMYAHTVVGLALSTALVWAARGRRSALGWMVGYAAHLAADSGGMVPLFYPFVEYDFGNQGVPLGEILSQFIHRPLLVALETCLLLWAGVALALPGRRPPHRKRPCGPVDRGGRRVP